MDNEKKLREGVEGSTKYLQGIDLPIMVNSVLQSNGITIPSDVAEMHIGKTENGEEALFITPSLVSIPDCDNCPLDSENMNYMLIESDGYSITTDKFPTLEEAKKEMEKKYKAYEPDENSTENE